MKPEDIISLKASLGQLKLITISHNYCRRESWILLHDTIQRHIKLRLSLELFGNCLFTVQWYPAQPNKPRSGTSRWSARRYPVAQLLASLNSGQRVEVHSNKGGGVPAAAPCGLPQTQRGGTPVASTAAGQTASISVHTIRVTSWFQIKNQ